MSARSTLVSFAAVSLSLVLAAGVTSAQGTPGSKQGEAAPAPNARRLALEQRFRERTAEVVKQRLALTDAQMTRLQAINRQFEQQRADINRRERQLRLELRAQLVAGDSANQNKVGQLLDQSIQLQRQRLDVLQSEQRELAKFMNPVQRARYVGMQNELRKRALELRNGKGGRRMNGMRQPPPPAPRR
jgi:hypothetical protein